MEKRENIVTMRGNPITLIGAELKVGAKAPEFTLSASDFSPVSLSGSKGRKRLLLVVRSIDAPTCATEAVEFNKRLGRLSSNVIAYLISRDLPFAQTRFCGSQGLSNLTVLSGYKNTGFGESYGVLIEGVELYTRAVFVIDENANITYVQVVKEISDQPNYEAALNALRE